MSTQTSRKMNSGDLNNNNTIKARAMSDLNNNMPAKSVMENLRNQSVDRM